MSISDLEQSVARHPAGKAIVNQYGLYVAGSKAPEALRAKSSYMDRRRRAGLESITGYAAPELEDEGRTAVVLPRHAKVLDAFVQFGDTSRGISAFTGIPMNAVSRIITEAKRALGFESRADLLKALRNGTHGYRKKGA